MLKKWYTLVSIRSFLSASSCGMFDNLPQEENTRHASVMMHSFNCFIQVEVL